MLFFRPSAHRAPQAKAFRFMSVCWLAASMLTLPLVGKAVAQEVNLYTVREPGLVKPLIVAFTAKTGIKVNTVFMNDGLAERVGAEGARSPADVMMTVDIAKLLEIVDKGLAQPVRSATLEAAVPAQLRDPDGRWFALSLRARLIYAAKDRVAAKPLTYEELADPQWKGRICIRSGQHPYNTALIAAYIAHHGEAATEVWLKGVKANLARKATGGDREVARDILGELCDIGLGNSYYVGLMRSGAGGPDQEKWGKAIRVVLPTFSNGGTHVNASGVALAKYAPNPAAAIQFMEFLVSDEGQRILAENNFEFPVKAGAPMHSLIAELGTLKPDSLPLAEIAKHRKAASLLVERIGFDQ